MEKLLGIIDSIIQHITLTRTLAFTLLMIVLMLTIAMYENRHYVYSSVISRTEGDYALSMPSMQGKQIMYELVKKYPNIALITLIDADPVSNTRKVVYRIYNDRSLEEIMTPRILLNPRIGDGVLFGANEQSNQEVLAIMTGEFLCAPNNHTILNTVFPGAEKIVTHSCRVPLPPAFNKATGWFTIHLKSWPDNRIQQMKIDALSMSLNYYNTEILKQADVPR